MVRLTRGVRFLLIGLLAAFVLQQTVDRFFGGHLLETFALIPDGAVNHFRFWQILTYGFLHADVTHLFFNGLMLFFVGPEIGLAWGRLRLSLLPWLNRVCGHCLSSHPTLWRRRSPDAAHGSVRRHLRSPDSLRGSLWRSADPLHDDDPNEGADLCLDLSRNPFFHDDGLLPKRRGPLGRSPPRVGWQAGFSSFFFEARQLRRRKQKAAKGKKPAGHLRLVVNNRKETLPDWDNGPRTRQPALPGTSQTLTI